VLKEVGGKKDAAVAKPARVTGQVGIAELGHKRKVWGPPVLENGVLDTRGGNNVG